MPERRPFCKGLFVWIILLLLANASMAQRPDSLRKADTGKLIAADSIPEDFMSRMKKFSDKSARESMADFNADKINFRQREILEEVKKTVRRAKVYLHSGIDTTGMRETLKQINNWYEVAGDGVFSNTGTAQTYRNLKATSNVLLVLLDKVERVKITLEHYQKDLFSFRYQEDSLTSDSTLFVFPSDSVTMVKYLRNLVTVAKEFSPTDSMLKQAITSVQELQEEVNQIVFKLQTGVEEIDVFEKELYSRTFQREFPDMWEEGGYSRSFQQIVHYSLAKAMLITRFYWQNNIGRFILMAVLLFTATIYLRSLKKIYVQRGLLKSDLNGQLILRYPFLSAVLIILCVFQFIFTRPPFIINAYLWIAAAIALTMIFRKFISRYWMNVWLVMLVLFFFACGDNLTLQASRIERWGMLLLALTGTIAGVSILARGPKTELKEQWILYSIALMTLMEAASLVTNLFGRYNLSKTLLVTGYFNVIIAIMFLWTVRLINEALSLAFHVYTVQERKLFYVNFEKVGTRAPVLFYIFMIAGWFILFGRNFYSFHFVSEPVKEFLSQERKVGEYNFSIDNLLIFILIMVVSMVISRLVSYFASEKKPSSSIPGKEERAGIGSWLLLVRIAIISLGVFFAFAAAGIPMDKLTIVIGALSVGIGLGLQTIVNNLVSGLIIAFEKPVNVGDVVEISGQSGTMKSIGFRSSVITTSDGADLVMPNGDLLNAHLINWTQGGGKRRITVEVGVAYETNLQQARELILHLLQADDRILKYPGASVAFNDFNNRSVDIQIQCWVRYFRESGAVKSDIIMGIHQVFGEQGIIIPFPQQEVYIHQSPDTGKGEAGVQQTSRQTSPDKPV